MKQEEKAKRMRQARQRRTKTEKGVKAAKEDKRKGVFRLCSSPLCMPEGVYIILDCLSKA